MAAGGTIAHRQAAAEIIALGVVANGRGGQRRRRDLTGACEIRAA